MKNVYQIQAETDFGMIASTEIYISNDAANAKTSEFKENIMNNHGLDEMGISSVLVKELFIIDDLKCNICSTKLKLIKRTDNGDEIYKCKECDYTCLVGTIMGLNNNLHHGSVISDNAELFCKNCMVKCNYKMVDDDTGCGIHEALECPDCKCIL